VSFPAQGQCSLLRPEWQAGFGASADALEVLIVETFTSLQKQV
jgi:hypothetical protein